MVKAITNLFQVFIFYHLFFSIFISVDINSPIDNRSKSFDLKGHFSGLGLNVLTPPSLSDNQCGDLSCTNIYRDDCCLYFDIRVWFYVISQYLINIHLKFVYKFIVGFLSSVHVLILRCGLLLKDLSTCLSETLSKIIGYFSHLIIASSILLGAEEH